MTAPDTLALDRRTFLRATGGAAAATAAAGTASRPVAAQDSTDLDAWFEGVENYDGVVDARGQPEVSVAVGAQGNGGGFAFEPAAVRVDPGATVVWEWTGDGGAHNVADEDGAYESPLQSDPGTRFEHAFDAETVSRYVCVPHAAMGMKGAVVVGDTDTGGASDGGLAEPDYGGWLDDVSNYERTVDARGQAEVHVQVGAEGNGGAFAFEPAAVRIDPGATVVWEWSGDGGTHDVVDEATGYASDLQSAAGSSYALTFDGQGISKYACTPHETLGMKGAIVVGAPAQDAGGLDVVELGIWGLLFAAVLSPFALAALLGRQRISGGAGRAPRAR